MKANERETLKWLREHPYADNTGEADRLADLEAEEPYEYDPAESMTDEERKRYDEFNAEQEAIHDGTATELTGCYLCHLEETGRPDMTPKASESPLRGIVRRKSTGGSDPYELMMLSCGHGII